MPHVIVTCDDNMCCVHVADAGGTVEWGEDAADMSVDEDEAGPSHNLRDMPWDNSDGEFIHLCTPIEVYC
jgi:hypothetical protein